MHSPLCDTTNAVQQATPNFVTRLIVCGSGRPRQRAVEWQHSGSQRPMRAVHAPLYRALKQFVSAKSPTPAAILRFQTLADADARLRHNAHHVLLSTYVRAQVVATSSTFVDCGHAASLGLHPRAARAPLLCGCAKHENAQTLPTQYMDLVRSLSVSQHLYLQAAA